jgi:hypothetical protein
MWRHWIRICLPGRLTGKNRIYKIYDGSPPISDTDQEEHEDNHSGVLKIC